MMYHVIAVKLYSQDVGLDAKFFVLRVRSTILPELRHLLRSCSKQKELLGIGNRWYWTQV